MTPPKITTLGCRLNAYESEAMREMAEAAGLENAVIINTCAVTAEATRKSQKEIRRLARENPGAKVIVTGCAAQTEPDRFAQMDEVTLSSATSKKWPPPPGMPSPPTTQNPSWSTTSCPSPKPTPCTCR